MLVAGVAAVELRYPHLDQLQRMLARFDALDLRIPRSYHASLLRKDLRARNDADLADTIERNILPAWREVHDQLAAYSPVPGPLRGDVATIVDYMHVRQQGFEMLVEAGRSGRSGDVNAAEKQLDLAHDIGTAVRNMPRARIPAPD